MKIADCLKREQIEQYLNGWTDEATAIEYEQHLSTCPDCEQTVAVVDVATKTELLTGRLTRVAAGNKSAESIHPNDAAEYQTTEELPAELRQAVAEIRQWNQATIESLGATESQDAVGFGQPAVHVDTSTGDFGNYELFELVGKGGMAEVYRARHKRLKRDVALKMIRVPRWHLAESLGRIEREMQAVGRLNHTAIVSALDAGEYNGIQFLVTEFIDGLDVGKIARAVGPLLIADACELVRVAAMGLDHAHAHGIVHRDIKPSNLMIDRDGKVKILDFGLVHLDGWAGVSIEVTSIGQLLGTLDYMAPEQADRPDQVSPRSDIYSLGATLFRLLSGRAPYAASNNQSPLEKLRLLANDRPPRVGTLCPHLPQALADLIDRLLARNPDERPSSAAHVAEALQPFCDDVDLAGLVKRALGAAPDSTLLVDRGDSLSPSLASLVSHSNPTEPKTRADRRFRRIWQTLVGLALLFVTGFFGIVLILDTQKGQIVIETDVPNLQVELLAGGEVRQEIELIPGENSTRIYAGEYEIRINDGTDRYVLDQNTFVLKRGEKVVARVTVNSADRRANIAWNETAENQIPAVAGSTTPTQPVYDGKTVDEWLSVLKFETNGNRLVEAIDALSELCANDVETVSRCRQFAMESILAGKPARWTTRRIVESVGLSDDDYRAVESMLMSSSIETTQALVELLATDASMKGQKNGLAKAVRFQKTLLSLESRPELFSAISGTNLVARAIVKVVERNSSSRDFVKQFLTSVLEANHLGPQIILGREGTHIFYDLCEWPIVRKLIFVAAFRAIEQYGIEDPEFLKWMSALNGFQIDAPADLVNRLPKLLDDSLLASAKSENALAKQDLVSTTVVRAFGRSKPVIVSEKLSSRTIGRIQIQFDQNVLNTRRDADGNVFAPRLASPALDLLLIRDSLAVPLDENARQAIEAVRDATADKSQQLIELLTAEKTKLGTDPTIGEPKLIITTLPASDDSMIKVIAFWTENGRAKNIEGPLRQNDGQFERFQSYADTLMKNYDRNQDGSLDKDECSTMRRPPANADANQDGSISLSELVSSLSGATISEVDSRITVAEVPISIQVGVDLVIAAIIHEQASLMLEAQSGSVDSKADQPGESQSDPQSSPNPPPSTNKNPAAKND